MNSKAKVWLSTIVESSARNPIGWFLYAIAGRFSAFLAKIHRHAQSARQRSETARLAGELFPDLSVVNGPFKGLKYAAAQSVGSALLPKLLGAYESELHPVLENMLSTSHYSTVVDIGCAEGYYAVGLALRLPSSKVYAFDTAQRARRLCGEMARVNGVADRVHLGYLCDEETLKAIPLGEKALIFSDCEGYEGALFNRRMAEFLIQHDVIIETHDFIDIELSGKMRAAFATTHQIFSIRSMSDIERVHAYRGHKLDRYKIGDRHLILSEERPILEWLVMTTKQDRHRPILENGLTYNPLSAKI